MSLMVELDKRLSWIKTAYIGVDRDFILGYSNKIALIEGLFEYDTYKHKKRVHILKEDIDRFLVEGLKFSSKDDPRFIKLVNRVYGMYKGINDRERSLLIDRLYRYYSNTLSNSKDFVFNPFDKKTYPDVMSMIHGLDSILRRMDVKQGNVEVMNPDKSDIPLVYKDENRGIEVYRADNMFQAIKIGRGSGFCTTADCLDDRSVDNMYLGYKYSDDDFFDLKELVFRDIEELENTDMVDEYLNDQVDLLGKQRTTMYFVITEEQMYNVDVYVDGGYLVTGSNDNLDYFYPNYRKIIEDFDIFGYIDRDVFKFVETPITLQELRYSHGYAAFIDGKLHFSDNVLADLLGYNYDAVINGYGDQINQIKLGDLLILEKNGDLIEIYKDKLPTLTDSQITRLYIKRGDDMFNYYPDGINRIDPLGYIPVFFNFKSIQVRDKIYKLLENKIAGLSNELFIPVIFIVPRHKYDTDSPIIKRIRELKDVILYYYNKYRTVEKYVYKYAGEDYYYSFYLDYLMSVNPIIFEIFYGSIKDLKAYNWLNYPIKTNSEFISLLNSISDILDNKSIEDRIQWMPKESVESLFKLFDKLNIGSQYISNMYYKVLHKLPKPLELIPDYIKNEYPANNIWSYALERLSIGEKLDFFENNIDMIPKLPSIYDEIIDEVAAGFNNNDLSKLFRIYIMSEYVINRHSDALRKLSDRYIILLHNKFPDNEVIKNEIEKRGLDDK